MEFGVHKIESETPLLIIGRCYKGNIKVGSIFNKFTDKKKNSQSVHFEVIKIEAYNHSLNEIDEGLTARLTLNGHDKDILKEEGVLWALT